MRVEKSGILMQNDRTAALASASVWQATTGSLSLF